MRLLIVTEHFWPEDFRITDLAVGLHERGHDVEVLTGMPSYPVGRYFDGYRPWGPFHETHKGVKVMRVPIVARGRGQAWRLALNYASYAVAATARLPLDGAYDATFVFQPSPVTTCIPALALRALTGTPVAVWVQDLWPEAIASTGLVRSKRLMSVADRLSRHLYAQCDLVLGQSRAFLPQLEQAGVASDRLGYLPNWAEDLYSAKPEPGGADEPWQAGFPLMFAGNLGRVQALDTLLETARLTRDDPEVRWVMVGDGGQKEWLVAQAKEAGLSDRFFFLGRKPVTEMPRLFARAGAMLVSLKPGDTGALTIPSKVQSYLAAGRPILGSLDGEGARVIEESGAGWAAPAADAKALAANIRRMKALGANGRDAMGRRGRAYYGNQFDRDIGLDRLERRLTGLVEGRPVVVERPLADVLELTREGPHTGRRRYARARAAARVAGPARGALGAPPG
jgi:glycosyltransferase involved in cell wall biosynthesis